MNRTSPGFDQKELRAAGPSGKNVYKLDRVLLDSLAEMAILLTPEGRVVEANPAALAGFHLNREQTAGRLLSGLLDDRQKTGSTHSHTEAQQVVDAAVQRAAQGELVRCEAKLAGRGRARRIELAIGPLREGDGQIRLLVAEGRDVTEEREREEQIQRQMEALEQKRHRLEQLLAEAPAAVGFVCGPDHRWGYINEAYVRLTGRCSAAEFLGKTARETMPEMDAQGFHNLLDQVYRSGQPFVRRDVKAQVNRSDSRQPETGYFDFTYWPLRDPAGKVEGVYIFALEVTDKVAARKEVEENTERLRLAQEAGQIGSWEWDPVEDFSVLSPELHRIFGTSADDAERVTKWHDNVYAVDRQQVEFLMYEGHRLGTMEMEYRYHHPDLGLRWLFCKGRRRPGETRMFGVVQDITRRKLAEQDALRLAAIVESSDDAIVGKDLNGIIKSWNPGAERLFGYSAEEIIGQPILRLIPEERYSEEEMILSRIRSGRRVEPFETTRIRKDGQRIEISVAISPVRDSSGTVIGASKIARDISERRRKDELRFRLAAIVESSDDAIVSKDLKGIVTSWNPAAERLFGYTAQEMIGQPITRIIPPELYADESRILATIASGGSIDHFETVRVKKNGELIEVSLTVSPVRDESGGIIGAAKIARDITERKKVEQALRTTERLASVGRLAATVAHEINNPLEAVTNLVFLARHAPEPEQVQRYLEMAEEELERVSHLTKQTLGFYRETKGATSVRMGALVQSLLTIFTPRMRNRGIALTAEILENVEVRAIPGEIRQVLANLLSNSIDALESGGKIRVRVAPAVQWDRWRRSGVRLTVADNGSGIPVAIRAQLFEPFFTTKKDVGTGLGLWICRSIVENHQGTIQVHSCTTPGRSGTTFSVFLPLDAPRTVEVTELRPTGT